MPATWAFSWSAGWPPGTDIRVGLRGPTADEAESRHHRRDLPAAVRARRGPQRRAPYRRPAVAARGTGRRSARLRVTAAARAHGAARRRCLPNPPRRTATVSGDPGRRSRCCRAAIRVPVASPTFRPRRRSRRTTASAVSWPRPGGRRTGFSRSRRSQSPSSLRSPRLPSRGSPSPPRRRRRRTPRRFFAARPLESRSRLTEPDASVPAAPDDEDVIYQRMLSEMAERSARPGQSPDLDWQSVWDRGWSLAAEAEDKPVESHTDHGLPVRTPGARLVPGARWRPGARRRARRAGLEQTANRSTRPRCATPRRFAPPSAAISAACTAGGRTPAKPTGTIRDESSRAERRAGNSLDWLVSKFAREVPGVAHALLVSVDGLPIAASEQLPRERADQLAAVASGLASLASRRRAAVRRRAGAAVGGRDAERLPVVDAGR